MKILSVFDPEFKPYGKVVTGMEQTCAEILKESALTDREKDLILSENAIKLLGI